MIASLATLLPSQEHGGAFNPWDPECGDEYFDADDDFLWAHPFKC